MLIKIAGSNSGPAIAFLIPLKSRGDPAQVDEAIHENEQLFPGHMYRRPKFLEILLEIRREMAHEADYDVDLFAEIVRSDSHASEVRTHKLASADAETNGKPADTPTPILIRRSRRG